MPYLTTEDALANRVTAPPTGWRANPRAAPYVPLIEQAASAQGIPSELLGELVQRESQFDPQAVSPSGAVGLTQLMPIHHALVNPRDPKAALAYSAKYLGSLKKRLGDWDKTLAAYNYGPQNVRRAEYAKKDKWREAMPPETLNYINALSGYAQ